MKSLKRNLSVFVALAMMFVVSVAQAETLSFENITNNSSIQLSSQLFVDISAQRNEFGSGVAFTFYNNVGIDSSITDVYFDIGSNAGLFSSLFIAEQSSGVSFDLTPHPENLPSGETIGFYSDFGGDSTGAVAANGVNAIGEYVTFLAILGSGFSYDDALAEILNGSVRLGMHVQAIAGAGANDSDSYATNVSTVPVPAAAWLFGTALFGFFATSRRKNNS